MRNLKKLVAFIVTLAMIATFAIPAFAAAPADVKGTASEGAVTRLTALGVINGYPDGSFRPDGSITRAEFAKVIVVALGHADLAATTAGVTKFSDVPVTHWATGYINLAVDLKIIKGNTDGTFAPDAPVQYEQAIAMIIRALGAGEKAEAEGGYYMGYLILAKKLGITTGITGVAGQPANRGVVAQLVDNAKGVVFYEKTGDETYSQPENSTDTMLARLGIVIRPAGSGVVVTQTPASVLLEANKFVAGGTTFTAIAGAVDVDSLLGKKVNVWGSADDKVVLVEVVAGTAVAVKAVTEVVYDDDDGITGVTVTLSDDTAKTYTIADEDAGAVETFAVDTIGDVVESLEGVSADQVEINLVVDGDALLFANANIFDVVKTGVTSSENKVVKRIIFAGYTLKEGDAVVAKIAIVKDGATVDYTAIKDTDVLFVAENVRAAGIADDIYYIKATSKTVAGTLEAAKPILAEATSIKVEGTWYTVSSFDVDGEIDASAIGQEVTVTLDPAGKAYSIAGPAAATSDAYGVILNNAFTDATIVSDAVYQVKMLTAAGDKIVYTVKDDVAAIQGEDDNSLANTLVKYTLNSDGVISALVLADDMAANEGLFDTSRKYFDGDKVSADVVIFSAGAPVKLSAIDDDSLATATSIMENADATAIVAMVLSDYDELTSAASYAYVTDRTVTGATTYSVDVLTKDGAKTFTTEDATATIGALVSYQVLASGNLDVLEVVAAEAILAADDAITSVDAEMMVVDGTEYWFAADALVIYDVDSDGAGASTLTKADLFVDVEVEVYLDAETGDVAAVVVTAM